MIFGVIGQSYRKKIVGTEGPLNQCFFPVDAFNDKGGKNFSMNYPLKILLTLLMVVAISEATKRLGFIGALLAALPVTSLIAMVWIYTDTGETAKIAAFSIQVFWFVIPSLGLFLTLPFLLKRFAFYPSLALASLVSVALYLLMLGVFRLLRYSPGI